MNWYQWFLAGLFSGWILHWFWNIWDSIDVSIDKRPDESIQEKPEYIEETSEPDRQAVKYIHIGDKIGTQVNDSLVQRSDLRAQEVSDAVEGLHRLGFRKQQIESAIKSIQVSGLTSGEIMKLALAKI